MLAPVWIENLQCFLSGLAARFAVPVFFLLSAVLLFKRKQRYLPMLKKKCMTLGVPYLVFNTLWILVFLLHESLPMTAAFFSGARKPILGCGTGLWSRAGGGLVLA